MKNLYIIVTAVFVFSACFSESETKNDSDNMDSWTGASPRMWLQVDGECAPDEDELNDFND